MSNLIGWNIEALRNYSRNKLSKENYEFLDESIDSVAKRQYICTYHRELFLKEYHLFLPPEAGIKKVLEFIPNMGSSMHEAEDKMNIACAANALAYMQSAHAVVDTMSHVIYFALSSDSDIEMRMKPKQKINMSSVIAKIQNSEKHSNLLQTIDRWKCIGGYSYLEDFTNQIKHRYLVSTKLSLELDPAVGRVHGLRFVTFEKDGRSHSERYIDEFFDAFNEPFFSGAFDVGQSLNSALGIRAKLE